MILIEIFISIDTSKNSDREFHELNKLREFIISVIRLIRVISGPAQP